MTCILDEMQAARAKVKDIIKIKAANQIPIQLQQALNETVKCKFAWALLSLQPTVIRLSIKYALINDLKEPTPLKRFV